MAGRGAKAFRLAYDAGAKAAFEGKARDQNPYINSSHRQLQLAWKLGHKYGEHK